ncbi:MAG: hypothetical protein IKG18_17975 [Atopobiaceae bacterium]|nr:hypothetical protein [Atopobiaceae bacterium]
MKRQKRVLRVGLSLGLACAMALSTVPSQALAEAIEGVSASQDASVLVDGDEATDEQSAMGDLVAIEDEGADAEQDVLDVEPELDVQDDLTADDAATPELEVEDASSDEAEDAAQDGIEVVESTEDADESASVEESIEETVSTGEKESFGITAQADVMDISKATIRKIAKQPYTGKAVTPALKVTLGGKTLKSGTDYTVTYANNTKAGTASATIKGSGAYTGTKKATFKIVAPGVAYRVHVQSVGNQAWKKNGACAGTTGMSRRLEAIWLKLGSNFPVSGGIRYRTHVQTYGWQPWKKNGALSGTTGESKRLEAIQIKLTGNMAKKYDVYYRVHAQNVGWMAWAKNGEVSGTSGMSFRLEAIQVVIVPKDAEAPGNVAGIVSDTTRVNLANPGVTYRSYVQSYGWQGWVKNGENSGTEGESKRLEVLKIKLDSNFVGGGIRYRTHVQSYGWQGWKKNGALSGTKGKRLEAIKIQLTGDASKYFDVWYRAQVQSFGWLGWAKNGQNAGTANLAKRMEALQIKVLPKNANAPGSTEQAFLKKDPRLSGDEELDTIIGEFIKQTGTGYAGLRRAYEIISGYWYSQGNRWPGPNWEQWSIPYAKEMYYNQTGNCYRYASLMCWTARRLGYDAKVVPGWIPGRVNPHCDHGWVEVNLDGEIYIIDAEMNGNDGYPEYNWFMIKYADAHLRYYDLDDNRLLK